MRLILFILLIVSGLSGYSQDRKPVKYKVKEAADKCAVSEEHRTGHEYLQAANNRRKTCPMDSLTFSLMLREYEQAVKLEPDLWKARLGYARMLMHFGRYEEAAKQLTKTLENPKSAEEPAIVELRAESYYNIGNFAAALEDLEKASTINSADLLLLKAKTLKELGRLKDACREFRKAVKLNPGFEGKYEFCS